MLARCLALLALLTLPGLAAAADDAEVRVRVLDRERPASVVLRAVGAPATLLLDGRPALTLPPDGTVAIDLRGGNVTARALSVVETVASVTLQPSAGGHFELVAGRDARPYRGRIEVSADAQAARGALRLINVVGMEDYVASVIPSEYPFPEMEGVKAQAVLVRTHALRARGRRGDHDVVDHVGSQVYRGLASETDLARQAAIATRGVVLTYEGTLIEAVYYSSSGGHTTDNETVWAGNPLPYLRGRPDPYDSASPLHRWRETVERDRLLRALSRHYGFRVTGISIASTTREGRAAQIRIHGSESRTEVANAFRLRVNELLGRNLLKSTFFTLSTEGGRYVFDGRGFGHGVGMSQYGAREQARQGRSFHEILAFYYPGTSLAPFDEPLAPLRPDLPVADRSTVRPPVVPVASDRSLNERLIPRPPTNRPQADADRARRTGW